MPMRWRRLGSFSDAGWSPRGLHVVGVDGHRVVAVDPAGTQKWSVTRPGRVHHPAWGTGDGFFVAYLEGHMLRPWEATARATQRSAATPRR